MKKGIRRILSSSKGIVALGALLLVVLTQALGLPQPMASTIVTSALTLAGLYIVGTAVEDHGAKRPGGRRPGSSWENQP